MLKDEAAMGVATVNESVICSIWGRWHSHMVEVAFTVTTDVVEMALTVTPDVVMVEVEMTGNVVVVNLQLTGGGASPISNSDTYIQQQNAVTPAVNIQPHCT